MAGVDGGLWRGLQVEAKPEFQRLFHAQVGWCGTFQDLLYSCPGSLIGSVRQLQML
jgi:hypothetical protein